MGRERDYEQAVQQLHDRLQLLERQLADTQRDAGLPVQLPAPLGRWPPPVRRPSPPSQLERLDMSELSDVEAGPPPPPPTGHRQRRPDTRVSGLRLGRCFIVCYLFAMLLNKCLNNVMYLNMPKVGGRLFVPSGYGCCRLHIRNAVAYSATD